MQYSTKWRLDYHGAGLAIGGSAPALSLAGCDW